MAANNIYLNKKTALRLWLMATTLQHQTLHSIKEDILNDEHDDEYIKLAKNWFKETAEEYDCLCTLKSQCWDIFSVDDRNEKTTTTTR